MTRLNRTRTTLALATAIALAALATAVADFGIYGNNFGSKGEFKEISRSGGGKACDRRYREKAKSMVASVRKGNRTCSFRPPVQGDGPLPNHTVTVEGKVLKKTKKSVRGGAFLTVTVRSGGGDVGYELRIFPKKKRFQLLRTPGGAGFPVTGRDKAVKGINDRNNLRLAARGAKVTAVANGKQLASVDDANPAQVSGAKIRFGMGNRKDKSKPVVATFKRVAVAVP
jgi:hypothetical protein